MSKTNKELNKTAEELSEIKKSLMEIRDSFNEKKYEKAYTAMQNFLTKHVDIQKKLNELKEEDLNKTKEISGLVKSVVENKGNALKIALDLAIDPDNIDKVRGKILEEVGSLGLDIQSEINSIFNFINGSLEAGSEIVEMSMERVGDPIGTIFKDIKKIQDYISTGINSDNEVIMKGYERGSNRFFLQCKTDLTRLEDFFSQFILIEESKTDQLEQIDDQQETRFAGKVKQDEQQISKQKEIIDEGKRAWVFDIDDAIKQYETEIGEIWKFTEEGQELYANYFAAKKSLYEAEGKDILEVYREQKDFENETTKFYQERERTSVEEKYNEDKVALKNQLADGIITREQYASQEEALTMQYLEDEIALRGTYGKDSTELESQLADMRLVIREREEEETAKSNAEVEQTEATSHKTRLDQWKDYAQKAAEISQKISEATSMVTNSLGGMFGQLGSYYADQVQAFADKIAVLDEEKEAALERVALSEEERQEKENEIALQRIELEYATSEEQRTKADERIATLQGELSAEDTINREFGDKKAELEKEKAKKEEEQKKAEKMEKRLQMSQSIVEAIGNVAAGAAKGLSYGPILGPIMAAIVTAAGAVQVGIMTKQLTKMKDGGLLHGFSHSQGGMRIMGSNVEVEGGEYVVNKQSTRKNLGLLEYINGERRGLGYSDMNTFFGQNSTTPSFLTQMMNEPSVVPQLSMRDSVDTQILNAIERINFQPRVSVTDINTVHESMVKVDEWTGM